MIEEAEKSSLLNPGGTIIEASSGNQGVACAMIGAVKGYKVIITVSSKISKEKLLEIFQGWNAYTKWADSFGLRKEVVKKIYFK